jgi:UDP-sugar pyrophosphorylase
VTSGACVLRVYCEYILAAQRTANAAVASPPPSSVELPLAIMVSSDTEAGIVALLEANDHFGLKPSQVTLLRQEKVAALMDSEARFAKAGEYEVVTKPHGHGDVHFLLHSTGTARRWHDELGIRWLHFFQDTNTLYFSNFLATVGVSATHGIAVNLVASPRKAKEAVGGVCRLTHEDGRTMVANVEYNQLEPLLVASGFADGDVNEPETGFSRFPGNINQIIISLPSWLETISSSGGAIAEFVNPKYTDGSRTAFKSPTRLECMMQDYVKTVPAHHRVAWTRYPLWLGYFPCKNDIVSAAKLSDAGVPPHSASTSEMAVYHHHAQQLRVLGASVGAPIERSFRGVKVAAGPSVVLAPSFAPCFTLLAEKVHGKGVSISARSSLVVRGEKVRIERLELDGALVIDVADGGSLTLRRCSVRNGGWELRELGDEEAAAADEENAIRGYVLHKGEQREIRVAAGEDVVIDEGGA